MRGVNEIDSVGLNIDFVPCNKTKSDACARQTLEGLKTFLGKPELIVFSNSERFDNSKYTDECIVKESTIWNQHINKN